MLVEINGLKLNYVLKGSPEGLPVVFIHGFPFSHRMWEPQLAALPHRYRAIAYDVRGHGASDTGDGLYTIDFFVNDLIGLLDYLTVEKVVVCGLSMGGYIALRAVERYPRRFRGMVLCDTRSEADNSAARIKRADTIEAVKSHGVRAFAENFIQAVLAPDTIASRPSLVNQVKEMIIHNNPTGICGTLLAMAARSDTTPALEKMKRPALILVGEHDTLTTPDDARRLQERLPKAELALIPRAAHMSNLENPTDFNERLLAFLDSF